MAANTSRATKSRIAKIGLSNNVDEDEEDEDEVLDSSAVDGLFSVDTGSASNTESLA